MFRTYVCHHPGTRRGCEACLNCLGIGNPLFQIRSSESLQVLESAQRQLPLPVLR